MKNGEWADFIKCWKVLCCRSRQWNDCSNPLAVSLLDHKRYCHRVGDSRYRMIPHIFKAHRSSIHRRILPVLFQGAATKRAEGNLYVVSICGVISESGSPIDPP